jgi:hypothetical protein
MVSQMSEKKRIEAWILDAARKAGVPIPAGEIPGEEPDFRFDTGLGIELSELVRPAGSNHGILPVEEAAFHSEVARLAEEAYYRMPDVKPTKVGLYFRNARGQRQDKRQLAKTVAEFVKSKADQATPFAAFYQFDAPEQFVAITIMAERAPWFKQ